MIDCALVYPNPSRDSPNRNLALGIMIVGAALEQRGFTVEYLDTRFDSLDRLRDLLAAGVRAVGVSAMTGEQCVEASRIFELCKQVSPSTATILGGVHGSMVTGPTLEEPALDFIVIGEGEETICELMSALRDGTTDFRGIQGLAWKDQGEPIINKEREFTELENAVFPLTRRNKRYFEIAAKTRHLSYYTTRGCPFRCAFCYNLVFNRREWRKLPEQRLEEDLRRLRSEIDFDHVYMVDDYLGRKVDRLGGVAETMRRVGLTWHSSIRVNDISQQTATILSEGNCTLLLLGVESASEEVQQGVLVKDYRGGVDDVRKCVTTLAKTPITPLYSFMYNVPGESDADLAQTAELAEWIYATDHRARIGFYAYTPYPGTPLYIDAVKNGFVPPKRMADWGEMSLSNELSPKLRDLYFIAGLRFRGRRGDRTDENFPGWRRLQIAPFELAARLRWKTKRFVFSDFERWAVRTLIERATRRGRGDEVGQRPARKLQPQPPLQTQSQPAPPPDLAQLAGASTANEGARRPRSLPVVSK